MCGLALFTFQICPILIIQTVLTPNDGSALRKELIKGSCASTVKIVQRRGMIGKKGKAKSD